jgi:hypothetical protein
VAGVSRGRASTLGPDGGHLEPQAGWRVAEQSEFKAILHYKFKPRELHEALSQKKKKTNNKQITTTKILNQTNAKQKTRICS